MIYQKNNQTQDWEEDRRSHQILYCIKNPLNYRIPSFSRYGPPRICTTNHSAILSLCRFIYRFRSVLILVLFCAIRCKISLSVTYIIWLNIYILLFVCYSMLYWVGCLLQSKYSIYCCFVSCIIVLLVLSVLYFLGYLAVNYWVGSPL